MNKLIIKIVCFGFLLCSFELVLGAEAPIDPEQIRQDSLRAFRKARAVSLLQAYPGVKYRIDSELGIPRWLDGNLSQKLTKGEPVEAAYEFFETNKELFGLAEPASELKIKKVQEDDRGMTHVFFKQLYRNVEVWQGEINAHFSSNGGLYYVNGLLYPDIDLSTTPSIDSGTVINIVKKDLGLPADYRSKDMEAMSKIPGTRKVDDPGGSALLCIMPFENKYHLVWLVRVHKDRPSGAWEYSVDAKSGQILHKTSRMRQINVKDNLNSAIFAQAKQSVPVVTDTSQPIFPDSSFVQAKPTETVPKEFQLIPVESAGVGERKKPVGYDSGIIVAPPPGSDPKTYKVRPIVTPPGRKLPVDDSIPGVVPIPSVPSTKPISPGRAPRAVPTKKKKKAEPDSAQFKPVPQPNTSQVLPDLAPYLPSGWSDRIVVSGVRGTHTHSPAVVGELAFIDWAGENRGSTIEVQFTSVLRIDGQIVGYFNTDPPTDNTAYFFFEDFEWTFSSSGLHTIQIEIDIYNQVAESDETNNTYAIAVTVQPRPDLVYTTPSGWAGPIVVSNTIGTHTQSTIYANEFAYIDFAAKNQGGTIRQTFNSALRINGFVVSTTAFFPDVNQNQVVVYEDFAIVLGPAGTYNIEVIHDYFNTVTESNESNNITPVYQVIVQAVPDLKCSTPTGWPDPIVVSNVTGTNSQSSPIAGQFAFIDFAVINQGTGPTSSTFWSRILVDGQQVATCYKNPPFDTNVSFACYDQPCIFTTRGTHSVTAEHDYLNNIDERNNEGNNSCSYQVNVLPGANLKCYTPTGWDGPIVVSNGIGTATQETPTAGEPAYIDIAGKNAGTEEVYGSFWSALYVDDVAVWTCYTDFLPGPNVGFSCTDLQYTFTSGGTHILRLVHDYQGVVAETDESDNSCTYSVYVNPPSVCTPDPTYPPGTGIGVHGDSITHIDTKCNGVVYLLMDETRRANLNRHGHSGRMLSNATISTYLWDSTYPGFLMTDPDNVWDSPEHPEGIDAHVHAAQSYDYFNTVLKRNGFDDIGSTMISTVQSAEGQPDVAAWDPTRYQVIYFLPSTPNVNSTAGSIDIGAHEWGHAVTQFCSNLIYRKEPGALDEAFSNMLGVCTGFHNEDLDWTIGEDVNTYYSEYANLSNPYSIGQADTYRSAARNWHGIGGCTTPVCDPMDPNWNDCCWVHFNSGVPGLAFYLFANGGTHPYSGLQVNGIGNKDSAMRVMYVANSEGYWTANTDFLDARMGSIRVADSLNSSWGQELRKAWEAVGVCEMEKGDINGDGSLTFADAVRQVNCVFLGTDCNFCASDMDCKDRITPVDYTAELNKVIFGTPEPCPPP